MTSLPVYFANEESPTCDELLMINKKVSFMVLSKIKSKILNYQQAKVNKFTDAFFVNSKLISPYNAEKYVTIMVTFDDTLKANEVLLILTEIRMFFNVNPKLLLMTMSQHGCYTTKTKKDKESILVFASAIKQLDMQVMDDLLSFGKIPQLLVCEPTRARITLLNVEDMTQGNIKNAVEHQFNCKVTKIISLNFNRLIGNNE